MDENGYVCKPLILLVPKGGEPPWYQVPRDFEFRKHPCTTGRYRSLLVSIQSLGLSSGSSLRPMENNDVRKDGQSRGKANLRVSYRCIANKEIAGRQQPMGGRCRAAPLRMIIELEGESSTGRATATFMQHWVELQLLWLRLS